MSRSRLRSVSQFVGNHRGLSAIVAAGVGLRVLFWAIMYPIWKQFATFLIFELPLVEYLGNFQGYKPSRMPFYDLFSALFYAPTAPILGVRAVTVFSLVVSCASLVAFYPAARKFFDHRTALFATTLYAFYPKLLVLSARGYPEAAAVGVLVFSLYALGTCHEKNGALGWSATAGAAATLAYLLYLPAVLFGIWTALVVHFDDIRRRPDEVARLRAAFVPTSKTFLYVLSPGITGVAYLVRGPVRDIQASASGQWGTASSSLFVEPESYGLAEKTVRYVAYEYFDFWWHLRGFDKEHHVLGTVDKLHGFLGDLFWPFLGGWAGITLTLTGIIGIGAVAMVRRRDTADVYFLGLGAIYLFAILYRNAGWVGALQTRHIFPLFLAATFIFGVGATRVVGWVDDNRIVRGLPSRVSDVKTERVIHLLVVLGLTMLLVNGAANVYLTGENDRVSKAEPIAQLGSTAHADDTVAVTSMEEYWWTVLYSEGDIWPVVWVNSTSAKADVDSRTVRAEVYVKSPDDGLAADMLYASNPCGSLTPYQQRLVENSVDSGGSVIFDRTRNGGSRCQVRSVLVEISE